MGIFAVQILERGTITIIRPPLFPSSWICPYFIGNVRVHRQIPHAFYIWKYNYKTNKIPQIPLIPSHPLDIPIHAHARYKNVQNTPLLRTTGPNLFQTLGSLNSDQILKLNWLNSFV